MLNTLADTYVYDDLMFDTGPAGMVPEPGSMALGSLMALTFAGGTWWRRRISG